VTRGSAELGILSYELKHETLTVQLKTQHSYLLTQNSAVRVSGPFWARRNSSLP
jgi:hypothetical protein